MRTQLALLVNRNLVSNTSTPFLLQEEMLLMYDVFVDGICNLDHLEEACEFCRRWSIMVHIAYNSTIHSDLETGILGKPGSCFEAGILRL